MPATAEQYLPAIDMEDDMNARKGIAEYLSGSQMA